IIRENDVYYIVDKGSKSGIYINSKRVERVALHHLDRISLGGVDDYDIQFIRPDEVIGQSSSGEQPSTFTGERRLVASAKEELKNLARYVEVNQAFRFSLAPDDVLRLIVDAAIELAAADRGLIMLTNEEGNLEFRVARDRNRNDVPRKDLSI